MSDAPTRLEYLLPRTVVKIDGTVSVETSKTGVPVATRSHTVTLDVEADYDTGPQSLEAHDHWWAASELSLTWAADGRLSGSNQKSTGLGGEVVAAGVTVLSTLAKLSPLLLFSSPADLDLKESISTLLAEDDPGLARRRDEYASTIVKLQTSLRNVAEMVAESSQPVPDLRTRLETLQLALAAAHSEAATIEAHYEVWHAKRFPAWTRTFTYLLGTDQLVRRPRAAPQLILEEGEIPSGHDAEAALLMFGVVLVRLHNRNESQPVAVDEDAGIVYRLPSRIDLAVYEAELQDDAPPTRRSEFRLRSVVPAWVVDSGSDLRAVPLRSDFFHERSATVSFGTAGTLKKVSNSASGSQLVEAFGGAAGDVVTGLSNADKIAKAFPDSPDPALSALKAKVASKELEARLAKANKTIAGAENRTP